MLCSTAPLAAQTRTAGRVVRLAEGDTLPVGRVEVVLHRVGRRAQGPLDTVRADPRGRFGFRFTPDTTAAYLLSVRYDGIEYFSSPVATNPARPDTDVLIIVADTSSAAPVAARERTLLISRADESGTRAVVDWFVLRNAGERTRIAPDSTRPSWGAPLSSEAQNLELADPRLSQFSPEAVEFRGDSVLVFAPLSPGQKELVLQYRIPGSLRRWSVPAVAGIDSLFVLLEEPGAVVASPRLSAAKTQQLEGRSFRRWAGSAPDAATLEIEFPGAPIAAGTVLALLVVLALLGFAVLPVMTLRRSRAAAGGPGPLYLADAIAQLDAEYQEHSSTLPAAARERYAAERARLKVALSRALARPGHGS